MLYELLLGGVLTATLVPQFVRHVEREDDEAISAIMTVAIAVLVAVSVVGVLLAPYIVAGVHPAGRGCEQGCAAGARDDPGAPVHAADRLLRVHRARDRAARTRTVDSRRPRSRRCSTTSSSSRSSCRCLACSTGRSRVDRVRDDTALCSSPWARDDGRHRGDGARARRGAAVGRGSGSASSSRGGIAPSSRWLASRSGPSAT